MHTFDYDIVPKQYLSPEIVTLISTIHEYKGKQQLYLEANKDQLTSLLEIAKIQSTGASNRIEGIYTSDQRLAEIVHQKAEPHNRNEQEIAGYRDVLTTIHENYDSIPLTPGILLQLHRDLMKYAGVSYGGHFKNSDNVIREIHEDGTFTDRFIPTHAFETPQAIDALCNYFVHAINTGTYDPLLLIPMFILDFLCIHPFNDGNGRMSRLLTLMLLYQSGYLVGKYISLEMLIEKTKESYYDVLESSSVNWHDSNNNYAPFIKYYLGILSASYVDFESRIKYLTDRSLSKPDRILEIITQRVGKITKRELIDLCPDISKVTIERALTSLAQSGQILKLGSGRATYYIKNRK